MKKLFTLLIFMLTFLIFSINVKAYDKTIDDGVYIIHSAINDNYVIDANGAIASNGTNIQLYQNNGGLSQKWIVRYINDGYYQITSTINDNYALDVNGAIFNNSVNVQLWQKNNSLAQKWYIKENSNGYYRLVSYDENYSLDANGAIASNFTNIQLWQNNNSNAQKFRFEKIINIDRSIDNSIYTIGTPLVDNKSVDVYGGYIKANTNIQLYSSHNGDAQKYYVTYLGDGYYSIKCYLDVNYALSVNSNGNVELAKYNGSDSQKWIISKTPSGSYNVFSKKTYKALDIHGANKSNETNIETYNYNNGLNQQFYFSNVNFNETKTLSNGYYFINVFNNINKVLDVNNGVMEIGRNVEIYDLNYGINQKWYIEYLNNGYYKILCNKDKDFALQVDDSNVNIGKYSGGENQQWIIRKSSKGYYIISKNGYYLDLPNGNISNTTNIQVYSFNGGENQIFNFIKTADGISSNILKNGIYRISSALNDNMFVDLNGASNLNGTNIQLWYRNSSLAQKWYIEYLSNGYYKISSLVDLYKSVDVEHGSSINGTNVSIYDSGNNKINQQWIIKDAGDGYFYIISNCGGLYIDVANSNTANGTNILLWEYNGGKNQKFKFIKSEKETRVVDVSYHQGSIDWNKVYNSGIYGVILRIGYWNTQDERFEEYINEVKRLGIPYGIYLFSYANTTNGASIEANFTNNMMSKYNLNPTLGIYYDLEDWYIGDNNNSHMLSKEEYDNLAITYINTVSSYVGNKYKVKIYADLNHVNNRFGNYARSQSDWIAHYDAPKCGYTGSYSLWQYTSSATLDGIPGYVDMSYLY